MLFKETDFGAARHMAAPKRKIAGQMSSGTSLFLRATLSKE
jgi:hypothetical protein